MKILLFVEGHTEKLMVTDFLKRWLDKRTKQPVGIKVVRFVGWGQFLTEVAVETKRYLEGPNGSDYIAAIGLLDYQGPGRKFVIVEGNLDKTIASARHEIEKTINDKRFRMFFAVHELEAWLLSQPNILPTKVQGSITKAQQRAPEKVNSDTPPSKLLDRLYETHLNRSYRKTEDGPKLFRNLQPESAYAVCPNLKLMLDTMLTLAKQAGC